MTIHYMIKPLLNDTDIQTGA